MWRLPYKAAVLFATENDAISRNSNNNKHPASETGDLERVGCLACGFFYIKVICRKITEFMTAPKMSAESVFLGVPHTAFDGLSARGKQAGGVNLPL